MDTPLSPTLGPLVWLLLSLVVSASAAQLALGWNELTAARDRLGQLWRVLGAGVALGTGIWAVNAIAPAVTPHLPLPDVDPELEPLWWGLTIVATLIALGWRDHRGAHLARRLQAGAALATLTLGMQGAAVYARSATPPTWHPVELAGAWLAATAACLAAMWLIDRARKWARRARTHARLAAGVLIGLGVAIGQYGVLHAAGLAWPLAAGPVAGGALPGIALISATGVLLLSRLVLRWRISQLAARAENRRERNARALNDPLTGLPTRQLFEGGLSQAARRADAEQKSLALLLINLDGFKPINQSFGHLGGDQVLREVAARLRALAKPHRAARLGGDEFLILLDGDPDIAAASALANEVIAAIGAPFKVDARPANLTCSIGVVMYPEHGARSTMIGHAQAAMGAAKSAGGASHAFFEPRMIKGAREDAELLRDLRGALERNQLELYYQPKIHAPTGEITGAEALMRWHHPQRGMISPVIFIPLAERYGLIGAMGRWVIEEACRQARAWRDGGLRMRVAINLSVHQLRQPDLAAWIEGALQRHQINPDLITCEITESSAMDDTEVTIRVLGELDRVGVHLSIDDFGTGHSSLAYLRKLPADELKIDRSFVMDLETSEDARKVAIAVINLAKALNLKVVAEGVETEAQNRILREFGCDQLQGYLFAKPMSAKALALWAMDDGGPRTMNFRDSLFKETKPAAYA